MQNSNHHSVKVVDFRSDTFSLPTQKMREAIFQAEVGDAVFEEDPSVLKLEKKAATLFQKEAATFLPSGTMSNLTAILSHCNKRGAELIAGSRSHILLYEQTGAAQFGGVNIREIENNPDGTFSLDELRKKIRNPDRHSPVTSLICIENTHNVLGGKVVPQEWIDELCDFAKSINVPVHMDGARIFDASIRLKIPVSKIAKKVDSVTFCVSKNLGGPYGSVLVGTEEFIQRAKKIQKGLGGTARQVGFMAAAAIYALDNMVERLADDHKHAQMIANAIRDANNPHVRVPPADEIHSNMFMIQVDASKLAASELLDKFSTVYEEEKENPVIIKAFALTPDSIRFVLCCNNTTEDVEDAIKKVRLVISKIK